MTEGGNHGDQAQGTPADFPETRRGLEQLRTKLNTAYESATGIGATAAADKADEALDHVKAMLVELDREDAAVPGGAMQAATAEFKEPLEQLEKLKNEIAAINQDVKIFGDVLDGINTAAGLWKSCFSL